MIRFLLLALLACLAPAAAEAQALAPSSVQGQPRTAWAGTIAGTSGALTITNSSSPDFKSYMTGLQCFRTDAGTAGMYVTVNDTGATVMGLPNSGGGGGNNMLFQTALATSAVNTSFTVTPSTAITTIYCNAQGFFAP